MRTKGATSTSVLRVSMNGSRMPSLWSATVMLLLALVVSSPSLAQIKEEPTFDATPIELPGEIHSPQRPITTMDLLEMREIHGASISPDGRYAAFVLGQAVYSINGYRTGMFVISTEPSSTPRSLGTAGAPHWDATGQWVYENPQWSSDSHYFTYRMRLRTSDSWQLWRWNRDGGTPLQLTHVPGNVRDFKWTRDTSKIVLTLERPTNPAEGKNLSQGGILYDGALRPWEGMPVVTAVLESKPPEMETWLYDVNSGDERPASVDETRLYSPRISDLLPSTTNGLKASEKPSHIIDFKRSPNTQLVAYRELINDPARSKWPSYRLYTKAVSDGATVELASRTFHVAEYWWTVDSKRLYYLAYEGDGYPWKLMLVSAKGGPPKQVVEQSDLLTAYSVDSSGARALCLRENNSTPPQLALVNLTDGALRTIVDVNPEFRSIQISPATRIEGINSHGDHWFGHVVKPLNYVAGKRFPLVITTYRSGNFFLRGGSGNEYPIQVLAASGFVVLNIDVGYLENHIPGDFQTVLRQWASPLASMQDAIHRLSLEGLVDPNKVAITGFSHGSEIVDYAISHSADFSAAIESGGGSRDPYFYYMAGKEWQQLFSDWGLGGWPEGESRARWQQLSPALNADKIVTPLLKNVPDSEFLVGLSSYTSLQQLRKPVELFVYANEHHVKNQPKHRYEIYERNIDWLEFWLEGLEDTKLGKASQYARWRELRNLCTVSQQRGPLSPN